MQIKTHIGPDFRRCADDPDRLQTAIDQDSATVANLRALVADDTGDQVNLSHLGRQLSRLADHLLVAGQPAQALSAKQEAVGIWARLERDKAGFLAELDAAECRFELGNRQQALDQLDGLVDRSVSPALQVYRDFALEVRGRCRARMGRNGLAEADFLAALALRQQRGNTRQIEQTEDLLDRLTGNLQCPSPR